MSLILTSKQEQIVIAFNRYHYLTATQVALLLFSPNSVSFVNKVMTHLVEGCYLQRFRENTNSPYVYSLGRLGVTFLKRIQGGESVGFTPSEHKRHHHLFMQHWLSTSDFLIAAERLPKFRSGLEVPTILHDLTLKKMLGGRVVPDGYVVFREECKQVCAWLELDRSTEEQARWRSKVRATASWINQSYTQVFGTTSINICVATTSGERRAQLLQHWTEEELKERSELQWFLFAALPSGTLEPQTIFLEPIWSRLGNYESLL